MNWRSAAEFFAMGGDGLYVWGAYAAAVLAAGLECWLVGRRARAARAAIQAREAEPDA